MQVVHHQYIIIIFSKVKLMFQSNLFPLKSDVEHTEVLFERIISN